MNKPNLTIVILTKNEQLHLRRCLDSVINFCERIVIVDSFSDDSTLEIIKEYPGIVELYQNKFINYANQFQWGLDNSGITTDWVMRLDADEYIESDLQDEIKNKLNSIDKNKNCIFIRRKFFYKGKWIKHGAVYPLNLLRIWRNGQGRIEQRWMDEHIVVNNPQPSFFKGHIVDYNLNDMKWWIEKHIKYADREVVDLLNIKYQLFNRDEDVRKQGGFQARLKRKVKEDLYFKLSPSLRSLLYFLYRYLFRLGFLDGSKGWDFHLMQGLWYRSYVDIRYKELDALISDISSDREKLNVLSKSTGLSL
ncbi:glycosyltransferase family 2 protein [Escherichia coli]